MGDEINLNLPFDEETGFVCVEYPGIVKNETKMLNTLGGQAHVESVYNDPTKRLDLHFRPDDPVCKSVCADRIQSTSLLLKVCKYRRKSGKNEKEEVKYEQSICGNISVIYKFKTMCDYQFLPLKKDEESGDFVNLTPYLKVQDLVKDGSTILREAPLFIPPPIFTRLDTPQDYLYKNSLNLYKSITTEPSSKIGVARPHRFCNAVLVKYEDKVPEKPLPGAVAHFQANQNQLEEKKKEIIKLFEQQPVWSKNALHYKMNLRKELKSILPLAAYYSVTGPWRSLWIRFGYDPKLQPDAKQFQLIDFRLKRGMHTSDLPIKPKRSALTYKLPNLMPRSKPNTSSKESALATLRAESASAEAQKNEGQEPSTAANITSGDKEISEAVFVHRADRLPPNRQMFYMACFVLLPGVQDMINSCSQAVCTKENGWLLPKTTTKVREIITEDVRRSIAQTKGNSSKSEDAFQNVWKKKHAALSLAAKKTAQVDGGDKMDDDDDENSDLGTSLEEHTTQDEDMEEEDFTMTDDEEDKDGDSPVDEGWFLDDDEELIDGSMLMESSSVFSDLGKFTDKN